MKIKLYQLPMGNKKIFLSYAYIKEEMKEEIILSEYELVYDGEIEGSNLEDVFFAFNVNHPEGYTGRSMSVSDIVEINGTYYFCDAFGFKKLHF